MSNDQVSAALKEWLSSRSEIEIAMLYGSYASGKATETSDLDLAIALKHSLIIEERVQFTQELENRIQRKVDLVDLNQAHGLILKEILSANYFLVKRNPQLFAKILLRLWYEEANFGPVRRKLLEVRKSRVFGT